MNVVQKALFGYDIKSVMVNLEQWITIQSYQQVVMLYKRIGCYYCSYEQYDENYHELEFFQIDFSFVVGLSLSHDVNFEALQIELHFKHQRCHHDH